MPTPFPQPKDLREAAAMQKLLAEAVIVRGNPEAARYIAALDASHPTRFSRQKGPSVAVAVLWDKEKGQALEVATAQMDEALLFPYVPGFCPSVKPRSIWLHWPGYPAPPTCCWWTGRGLPTPGVGDCGPPGGAPGSTGHWGG